MERLIQEIVMAIDNKKEQERDELHRAIWAIADELRGAVDGWDFILTVISVVRYVGYFVAVGLIVRYLIVKSKR